MYEWGESEIKKVSEVEIFSLRLKYHGRNALKELKAASASIQGHEV